jgi:hypothetical protein
MGGSLLFAQDEVLKGEVTFTTTQNVYVRFSNASKIKIGDTLSLEGNEKCLLVVKRSSTSCMCTALNDCKPSRGTAIYFTPSTIEEIPLAEESDLAVAVAEEVKSSQEESLATRKESLRGRLSASTYSTLAGNRSGRHRFMSQLMLDADHINESALSFDVNMNYRHILDDGAATTLNDNDLLRIYRFALTYDATPNTKILLGRNINPRFSSVGPLDGLQLEQTFGKHVMGILAGTRPDAFNFGFNADLLQYGAFYGFQTVGDDLRTTTTVGALEQRAGSEIDRRFAYFQHSSSFNNRFNLYASAEVDLNQDTLFLQQSTPRLTNLYASARYRVNRGLNFMVSYDSRKRIIYYQTYRTELDRILDDDLARQGIRARVNFRPGKYIYAGLSYSNRFRSDQQNASNNYYGYLTLSKTPWISGRTALSLTRNESNYLITQIGSLRHSRSLFHDRLQADLYYRLIQSDYLNLNEPFLQHYAGTDITYYLSKLLLLSVTGEYSTYQGQQTYRIYTRIVQRFQSKRK